MQPLLQVRDLEVAFGAVRVLRGVSLDLFAGQTLGVVGESGCGKSMTGLALMGMLPPAARVLGGSIKLDGRELVGLREREWGPLRGETIAMVMQDPFTSLNPMMRIGEQIAEVLRLHKGLGSRAAAARAIELIDHVGVPDPPAAARKFPHQMSGGQRQRVVIAIAFACRPKVLIADEPTTALDVTLQAQILRLLAEMQGETGTAVMLISHNVGVIASMSNRVAVYYAGRVVESGPAREVLRQPAHPYTLALLDAIPAPARKRLRAIGGQPPDPAALPVGCPFQPRCAFKIEKCVEDPPLLPSGEDRGSACWRYADVLATEPTPI